MCNYILHVSLLLTTYRLALTPLFPLVLLFLCLSRILLSSTSYPLFYTLLFQFPPLSKHSFSSSSLLFSPLSPPSPLLPLNFNPLSLHSSHSSPSSTSHFHLPSSHSFLSSPHTLHFLKYNSPPLFFPLFLSPHHYYSILLLRVFLFTLPLFFFHSTYSSHNSSIFIHPNSSISSSFHYLNYSSPSFSSLPLTPLSLPSPNVCIHLRHLQSVCPSQLILITDYLTQHNNSRKINCVFLLQLI